MSSSNQWFVDLIQHLRTVHFALVLLSCGLISFGLGDSPGARTALPVVDEISRFCKQWPDDWVESLRSKQPLSSNVATNLPETLYFLIPPERGSAYWKPTHDPQIFDDGSFKVRWVPAGSHGKVPEVRTEKVPEDDKERGGVIIKGLKGVKLTLNKSFRFWTSQRIVEGSQSNTNESTDNLSKLYIDHAPTTLSEFQDWWDNARKLQVTYFGVNSGDRIGWSQLDERNEWWNRSTYLFSSPLDLPDDDVYVVPKDDVRSLGISRDHNHLIVEVHLRGNVPARLPIAEKTGDLEIKPSVLNPLWSARSGSFIEAFPELQAIQVGMSVRQLDSLRTKLEEQASEAQTLELGGLKFQVARWGILLILIIQLYFWILIRELNARFNRGEVPSSDVAWLGLFASQLGRVAFVFSLLLPTIAVFLVARQLLPVIYYQLGVTTLSLSMTVVSFVQLPRPRT